MGRGYGISGNVGSYMHVEKKPKLTPDEKDERLRNKKENKYGSNSHWFYSWRDWPSSKMYRCSSSQ